MRCAWYVDLFLKWGHKNNPRREQSVETYQEGGQEDGQGATDAKGHHWPLSRVKTSNVQLGALMSRVELGWV